MRAGLFVTVFVLSLAVGRADPAVALVGPLADVGVSVGAFPQAVAPGSTLTISVGVGNVGPDDAANVLLRIDIPAGTTFVSWSCCVSWSQEGGPAMTPPPGGTGTVKACVPRLGYPRSPGDTRQGKTFLLKVLVDPNAAQGQTITSTATVAGVRTDDLVWCPGVTIDPNPNNDTATTTATVSGPADVAPRIVSVWPDPVAAGGDLTYVLEVSNLGPRDAENVTLTDWWLTGALVSFMQDGGPAFSLNTSPDPWYSNEVAASIALFTAGATARFILIVREPATVPSWGSAESDNLSATSTTGDPDDTNNHGAARTQITPQ